MKPRLIAVAAAAAGLLLANAQAEAHARLVSAEPAANATVPAPAGLTLHFSERLEPKFSGFDLMKADGSPVAIKAVVSQKVMQGAPAAALAPGGYMVMWHAVSADGHKTKGDFTFTVR